MTDESVLDEKPLDPQAMLDIIEQETSRLAALARRAVPWFYFSWGGAWMVGYLLLWAAYPGSGSPIVVPEWIAWPGFAATIVTAIAISAIVGVRMGRGIRGRSSFVGILYGFSWSILSVSFAALGVALMRAGMSPDLAALYYPSVYAFVITALYLAGAMLWRSIDQLVIALVLAFSGAIAPFFGAPLNCLVMALVAGGALLVGGIVTVISLRSRR